MRRPTDGPQKPSPSFRVRDIAPYRPSRAGGVPVFFTIDAGPQVKAVCLPEAAATVRAGLADCDGVLEVLDSPLGHGARVL